MHTHPHVVSIHLQTVPERRMSHGDTVRYDVAAVGRCTVHTMTSATGVLVVRRKVTSDVRASRAPSPHMSPESGPTGDPLTAAGRIHGHRPVWRAGSERCRRRQHQSQSMLDDATGAWHRQRRCAHRKNNTVTLENGQKMNMVRI